METNRAAPVWPRLPSRWWTHGRRQQLSRRNRTLTGGSLLKLERERTGDCRVAAKQPGDFVKFRVGANRGDPARGGPGSHESRLTGIRVERLQMRDRLVTADPTEADNRPAAGLERPAARLGLQKERS